MPKQDEKHNDDPLEKSALLEKENKDQDSSPSSEVERESVLRISWKYEVYGFLFTILAIVCHTISASCVRAMEHATPDIELNGFRMLAIFLLVGPYFLWKRKSPAADVSKLDWFWITVWSISGVVASISVFASVTYIPLGDFISIERILTPLIMGLTSWVWYKEPVLAAQVVGLVLSILGAIMVFSDEFLTFPHKYHQDCSKNKTFPAMNFHNSLHQAVYYMYFMSHNNTAQGNLSSVYHSCDYSDEDTAEANSYLVKGVILAIVYNISVGVHFISQKARLQHQQIAVICFWYSFIGTFISFLIAAIVEHMTLPTSTSDWLFFMGHCLAAPGYLIFYAIGQAYGSLLVVSLAKGFLALLFFMSQYIVFHEISAGYAKYIEITGAVFVFFSATIVPLYEIIVNRHRNGVEKYQ